MQVIEHRLERRASDVAIFTGTDRRRGPGSSPTPALEAPRSSEDMTMSPKDRAERVAKMAAALEAAYSDFDSNRYPVRRSA